MTENNIDDIKKRIETEEDFIYCPRLSNSLQNMIDVHPDGVDDERISKVLLISEKEVESIFKRAIEKIRKTIGL